MNNLSKRVRPDVEASPWVVAAIKLPEKELADAYLEMRKVRHHVGAIYDRAVWDRAENAGKGDV